MILVMDLNYIKYLILLYYIDYDWLLLFLNWTILSFKFIWLFFILQELFKLIKLIILYTLLFCSLFGRFLNYLLILLPLLDYIIDVYISYIQSEVLTFGLTFQQFFPIEEHMILVIEVKFILEVFPIVSIVRIRCEF